MERQDQTDKVLYDKVCRKVQRLDPQADQRHRLEAQLAEGAWTLVESYQQRKLPRMALELIRRMSTAHSIAGTTDAYLRIARRFGVTLAQWRRVYDGASLAGWTGATENYQAYGDLIRAVVNAPIRADSIDTRVLVCDVPFESDFSLEAEVRIAEPENGKPRGSWAGLFFGRKQPGTLNAVLLHPDGFLDISTNRNHEWTPQDHRNAEVGHEWRKLRIDVTGNTLDVYLDDGYVRAFEFANAETLHGAFGLITGAGRADYRNIRILPRDRTDPAAVVERELAMERVAQHKESAAAAPTGSFDGEAPPELQGPVWVQGEPVTLKNLVGKAVLLVFWTPAQDAVIPTTAYINHLTERGYAHGFVTVVLCDAGTTRTDLTNYLTENTIPGAHIGIDPRNRTYDAYFIKADHYGIPRFLLLDPEGRVVFEGDPGLSSGVGWQSDMQTYVDAPFERLLERVRGSGSGDIK